MTRVPRTVRMSGSMETSALRDMSNVISAADSGMDPFYARGAPSNAGPSGGAAGEGEDAAHRAGVAEPGRGFALEPYLALGGEAIVAGAAVVLGGLPLGLEPAASLHALEGLVEGAVVDAEGAAGRGARASWRCRSRGWVPSSGLEDQKVEGAFEEGDVVVGPGHVR